MSGFVLNRFVENPDRSANTYDLLIVGGGISGAALAYEAASRGCSVALIDAGDFGGGTSAATGKLIHGGLRYLKQGHVRLVRESLRERRILCDIAPNLVHPYPIVLPGAGLLERAGLTAYDLLSFDRNRVRDRDKRIPRHRRVRQAEARSWNLGEDSGAVLFHDCMMPSPERLTLAFVRSAAARGADVANHTRAERFLVNGERVVGAQVVDTLSGNCSELHARVVVNATGPWSHDLLSSTRATEPVAGPRPPVRSEGIYLVTRCLTDVMTLHVSSRGHFSVAPWRGHSLIGPTETAYRGEPRDWRLTRESIERFLNDINASKMLSAPLAYDDVLFAYGGLRPLSETTDGDAGSNHADTYNASRGADFIDHAKGGVEGLVSMTGGKYTTSRGFAEAAYRAIAPKLGRAAGRGDSAHAPLHGCAIGPLDRYLSQSVNRHPDFSPETVRWLAQNYGSEHNGVLDLAVTDDALRRQLDGDGEILAQVTAAVRWEMARTLRDIVLRRTGIGTLGDPGDEVLESVSKIAAGELGWDEHHREAQLDDVREALRPPV